MKTKDPKMPSIIHQDVLDNITQERQDPKKKIINVKISYGHFENLLGHGYSGSKRVEIIIT